MYINSELLAGSEHSAGVWTHRGLFISHPLRSVEIPRRPHPGLLLFCFLVWYVLFTHILLTSFVSLFMGNASVQVKHQLALASQDHLGMTFQFPGRWQP